MVFEILDMGHGNHDMHHSNDGFEYEFQPKTESGATCFARAWPGPGLDNAVTRAAHARKETKPSRVLVFATRYEPGVWFVSKGQSAMPRVNAKSSRSAALALVTCSTY